MDFAVSTLATQLFSTQNLQAEQTNLTQLNEQLASGQKYDNLTNYAPVDANNIMNFQNAITQRQAYLGSMKTVNSRLSLYDTTMTDIENITSQAQTLASGNQTYNATSASQIQSEAQSYLQQIQDDLNQQIGGRYVYGGNNYTTPPVANLTTLGAPTLPFTPVTSPTLPDYSALNTPTNSLTVTATPPTGNFQIGNSYIKWSDLAAGDVTKVYNTDGTSTNVTITGLSAATTPAELTSNLQQAITQVVTAGSVSDFSSGITATVDGSNTAKLDLTNTGSLATITPDSSGTSGEVAWADTTDGTTSETIATTDAGAFTQDSVTVDNGYNVQYGVTSNATGFQQVIAGLRLMNAAASQTNSTTYQTDMASAITLLSTGLSNVQSVHAAVAGNINTLTQETTLQNSDISNLQNQLSDIQQVDLTSVGTQINLLQTQLQASYSATASLIQESILKYL